MLGWLKLGLALLTLATCALCEQLPAYTVIAPSIVRPNSDYLVAVSVHNIPKDGTSKKIIKYFISNSLAIFSCMFWYKQISLFAQVP